MVLYFTGSGNTKFVAEYIADCIGDECVSLNDMLKDNGPYGFWSKRPFVIAAPIYAWRFPQVIEQLIRNASFSGSKKVYFIGTMESQTGNCDRYLKQLAENKNMEFQGFCGVPMPNNYVVAGVMPTTEEAEACITRALPIMKSLAEKIASGESIEKCDKTPISFLLSGAVNALFNKFAISCKNFNVSEACISCGKCADICPVNNIVIESGIPGFQDKCLNCYACIHRCPVEAINIGKRTQKHGRYVCPEYNEWKSRVHN